MACATSPAESGVLVPIIEPSTPAQVAPVPSTPAPTTPTTPTTPTQVTLPALPNTALLETCAPALAWWREVPAWQMSANLLDVSPNGGLLLRSNTWDHGASQFHRLATGEPLVEAPTIAPGGMDAGWNVRAELASENTVNLITVVTQAVLRSFTVPLQKDTWGQHQPVLSPDAQRLAVASCVWGKDGQGASKYALSVAAWSTDDGQLLSNGTIGECDLYPRGLVALPTPDGKALVVTDQGPTVHVVELDSGIVHTTKLAVLEPTEPPFPMFEPVVAGAVRPDGSEVALVDGTGLVHFLAIPGLTEVRPAITASVVGINLNTYMPGVTSPIAWSADGKLLALVDPNGQVTMRHLDQEAPVLTFEAPKLAKPEPEWTHNMPVGVTFLPDGTGLAISYEQGLALWRCPTAPWPETGAPLELLISGPTTAQAGEPALFIATHLGNADVHSHRLYVDGQPVSAASLDRKASWTPVAAGTYSVSFVIDDGIAQGTAAMTVTVTN